MKLCSTCKENKSVKDFRKNSRLSSGLWNECRICLNKRKAVSYQKRKTQILAGAKKFREKYPDKCRDKLLKYKFNISLDDYNKMASFQGGLCAICAEPEKAKHWKIKTKPKALAVDHCHETGAIRGLLCHYCNAGLGHFRDDVLLMGRALEYLANSRGSL